MIRSPRITDGEVLPMANNQAAHDDVLRVIYSNREWTKMYQVKLALVKNPKMPQAIAMRFLATLRESRREGPGARQERALRRADARKKMMEKKNAPKKEEK